MRRYRNLEDSATMRVKDKQIMCSCKFKRTSQMRSAIRAYRSHNRCFKKSLKY